MAEEKPPVKTIPMGSWSASAAKPKPTAEPATSKKG